MVLAKAIFLDKDGTLIPNKPYCIDPRQAQLDLNTVRALRVFSRLGYQLFIISNQSGIARGYFTEEEVDLVFQRFGKLFQSLELNLQGYYYCPHLADDFCQCRKPKPGMLFQAATEHGIDLKQSWFIGDILHDVEAGRRAGCRTVLLDNGGETEWELSCDRLPDHIVSNLLDAAKVIAALHDNKILEQNGIDPTGINR